MVVVVNELDETGPLVRCGVLTVDEAQRLIGLADPTGRSGW
jgi:hypothetical protein